NQSGCAAASAEPGAARNGAIHRPGRRPADAMAVASVSSDDGNLSLVVNQSPIADWKPSSIWNTSKGQASASARFLRTSSSVTRSKYWYHEHQPTWNGARVRPGWASAHASRDSYVAVAP